MSQWNSIYDVRWAELSSVNGAKFISVNLLPKILLIMELSDNILLIITIALYCITDFLFLSLTCKLGHQKPN